MQWWEAPSVRRLGMLSVRRLATLSAWRRGTPTVQWWEAPSVTRSGMRTAMPMVLPKAPHLGPEWLEEVATGSQGVARSVVVVRAQEGGVMAMVAEEVDTMVALKAARKAAAMAEEATAWEAEEREPGAVAMVEAMVVAVMAAAAEAEE